MRIKLSHKFEDIISVDNLLEAWQEFILGKRNKKDVQEFNSHLMDNILLLNCELSNYTYKHGGYQEFNICDPKSRIIHKASVRDRLLHRAVYRILYPFFDRTFISDSFSCRDEKGTHRAIDRFRGLAHSVSKNNTKTCWVLKGDIKKFFYSIDQHILLEILQKYIPDKDIAGLLKEIITSFQYIKPGFGLPLGNLTSQLFANIYMNEFDQFVKHKLKVRHYIRYADDFVILSGHENYLKGKVLLIADFLKDELNLALHPGKVFIKTLCSGVDFLGWVNFPDHRVIRGKTKSRMFKRVGNNDLETLNSYIGMLSHGNTEKIKDKVFKSYTGNEGNIVG